VLRLAAGGQIDVSRPISRRCRLEEAYETLNRGEIVGRAIMVTEAR
jgi:hypothetical protein